MTDNILARGFDFLFLKLFYLAYVCHTTGD